MIASGLSLYSLFFIEKDFEEKLPAITHSVVHTRDHCCIGQTWQLLIELQRDLHH